MSETPMRRLPERKVWETIDGMLDDLESAYNAVYALRGDVNSEDKQHAQLAESDFLMALIRLRTLSDEIIRWKVL